MLLIFGLAVFLPVRLHAAPTHVRMHLHHAFAPALNLPKSLPLRLSRSKRLSYYLLTLILSTSVSQGFCLSVCLSHQIWTLPPCTSGSTNAVQPVPTGFRTTGAATARGCPPRCPQVGYLVSLAPPHPQGAPPTPLPHRPGTPHELGKYP